MRIHYNYLLIVLFLSQTTYSKATTQDINDLEPEDNKLFNKNKHLANSIFNKYQFSPLKDYKNQDSTQSHKIAVNTPISSYMWEKYFDAYDNETLINLLVQNNINKIFLSPNDNKVKVDDFLAKASSLNIEVQRMISENSYAEDKTSWVTLIEKLNTIKGTGFTAIHINIEPHTFEDYNTNEVMYTEIMNNIFIKAKEWCDQNNMKLSASIPMHLPIENAITMYKNNIEAYIMAYENTDQVRLLNRTMDLRNVLGDKFVWVVNLSDFSSKEQLIEAENVLEKANITKIGYYDVSMLNDIL